MLGAPAAQPCLTPCARSVDAVPQHWRQVIYVVGVLGRRPRIPAGCAAMLRSLISECWQRDAHARPAFCDIVLRLQARRLSLRMLSLLPGVCGQRSQPAQFPEPGLVVNTAHQPKCFCGVLNLPSCCVL